MLHLFMDCCWFAVLGGTVLVMLTAPLPTPPPQQLCEADLRGQWSMEWAGCPWVTHLGENGVYSACTHWATYSGSWSVRNGRLYITESNCPDDFDSFVTYEISLDRATLKGPIESANGEKRPGTTLIEFTRGK